MSKEVMEELLSQADIRVQGDRPWDIQVHNPDTYRRIMFEKGILTKVSKKRGKG